MVSFLFTTSRTKLNKNIFQNNKAQKELEEKKMQSQKYINRNFPILNTIPKTHFYSVIEKAFRGKAEQILNDNSLTKENMNLQNLAKVCSPKFYQLKNIDDINYSKDFIRIPIKSKIRLNNFLIKSFNGAATPQIQNQISK